MAKNKLELKDKVSAEKRHWVRITKACNNRCLFCLDSENQDGEIVPLKKVLEELRSGRGEGATRAIISGGEPTIHPDIFRIIREAKEMGYQHVQIISNGRMLAYEDFVKKLKAAGLDEVTISFHSHLKKQMEKMTRAKGSHAQAMKGLMNVLKYNLIVSIDIVINKINYKTLAESMKFFIRLGVSEFDLLWLIPFGNAWENRKKLFLEGVQAKKYLDKALSLASNPDLFIWTNRLPAQYLEGHEDMIQNPIKLRDEIKGMRAGLERFVNEGRMMACFGERCQYCFARNFCADLIELEKNGILEAKNDPDCLKTKKAGSKKTFFKLKKKFDVFEFLDFHIKHRYFVKSLRCGKCRRGSACSGVHIGQIRKDGFKILRPI